MRYWITGAGIAVVFLCSSCTMLRNMKAYAEWRRQSKVENKTIDFQTNRIYVTEYLGDSLSGRLPLPYTVPRSATWQIHSGGLSLDLTIEDSTLTYRSVAKPVARSQLIQQDSSRQMTNSSKELLLETVESENKKKIRLEWWVWPALILALVLFLLVIIRKIKIPF